MPWYMQNILAAGLDDADDPMAPDAIRKQLTLVSSGRFVDSFACTYIVSVLAAQIAEIVTYPLDLCKTRLQIQGEAASEALTQKKAKYRGTVSTAVGIVREEGFLKLWGGIAPALFKHVIYSGVRICTYDFLRQSMTVQDADGKNLKLPLWKSAICGIGAGVVGQWMASPGDLIKVHMQMEGRRRLMGEPARVHGMVDAAKQVYARGGIPGLWKGSVPGMQRSALVNLGDLTAYDFSKQTIMRLTDMPDCRTVHFLASCSAGLVAAILGTPADTIKTRIMNQPVDEKGKGLLYRGTLDCIRKTVAEEGTFALYKGFIPCWMRLGPWALTFWVSFEQIRSLIGSHGF